MNYYNYFTRVFSHNPLKYYLYMIYHNNLMKYYNYSQFIADQKSKERLSNFSKVTDQINISFRRQKVIRKYRSTQRIILVQKRENCFD